MGQENSLQKPPPAKPANNTPLTDSQWDYFSQTSSIKTNKQETLFTHNFKSPLSWKETINYISYTQTLRHPNIIKFSTYNSIPNESLELRTSPIIPLKQFLPHTTRPNTVQGIRELATAINFLHNSAKLCHLGLSVGEVFVDLFNGCWMLGGFSLTRKISAVQKNELLSIEKFALMKTEINQNESELTDDISFDVWLFKRFIDDVTEITKYHSLLEDLLDWLDTNWPELRFEDILNHETLNNFVTDTVEILTKISVMDQQEKSLFIESLPSRLLKLDECILSFRIVQLIFTTHLYMNVFVRENVLPLLLIPKSRKFAKELSRYQHHVHSALIQEDTFKQFIVPLIMRLFTKQELQLRIILLTFFKYYIYLFSYQQQLQIHPHLLVGLRDSREELAKLTFFALGELTSYLGVRGVTGQEVRSIFADIKPRDYQVSTKNDDVVDIDDDIPGTLEQTQQQLIGNSQQNDNYVTDFFENETKEDAIVECYPLENVDEENLFSELKKPKFNLVRKKEILSQTEFSGGEQLTEIQPHKQTLLELSQINSTSNNQIENGGDYLTDIELDSPTNTTEKSWEDWDPF